MSNFTDQQLQAITTIDNNVAVSAGAGSGKTRVLVERFLHILEQGKNVSPKEILAITFTRKAAGEMKERVRISMEDRLAADVNGFWKNHLQELERAQITTIHGFCNRLLKENQSTTTKENITFSKQIILEKQLSTEVMIITNDYHCYRAAYFAKQLGLQPKTYSAKTDWYLLPTFYLREICAIIFQCIL